MVGKQPGREPEDDFEKKFHLSEAEDAEFKKFGIVRIMVVGASGTGKSLLIKCMGFGDDFGGVPQPSSGEAGIQDITKVWRHPSLPFFIHDTNGVDSDGRSRIADIRKYLHQKDGAPFSEKVHLIWFVIRATDNRILEYNAELMKFAISMAARSKLGIPLQIVVTHMDLSTDETYNENVASHLDELLAGAPEDVARKLKDGIVKVGIVDEQPRDYAVPVVPQESTSEEGANIDRELLMQQQQALQELCHKTYAVLSSEEQKLTWACAQTVDVKAKLRETAKIIVSRQYITSLTLFTPPLVGVNEAGFIRLLRTVSDKIGAIWQAPPALRKAVWETMTLWDGLKSPILYKLVWGSVTLAAASVSGIAAFGLGFIGWLFSTCKDKAGTDFRRGFVTYTVIVAASFLFVRHRLKVNWETKTFSEYKHLLQNEFETTWLKSRLENIRIRGLVQGLVVEGQDTNVNEVESLLKEHFMTCT